MAPGKNTNKQKPVKKVVTSTTAKHPAKYSLKKYFFPVIILVSCLVLYGNTFNNDYTEDDGIFTRDNIYIKHGFSDVGYLFTKGTTYGFNQTNGYNYRPLTLLSFMTEANIFGLDPQVFQIFSVLYFALACIVLFFFLKRILKNYNPIVPMAATLLFVFHPIHTDAVSNFKSRDEILMLMFGMLCFYLLLQYDSKQKLKYYYFSVIAFVCALLCKETTVSYLIIIPLVLYFFTSTKLKKIVLLTLPFVAVIGVYLVIHKIIFGSITSNDPVTLVNNSLLAAKSYMDMYATNFVMLGKYIYLLFIPHPLSWDYSYPQFPTVSWSNPWAIISLLVYIAMGVIIITGFKKKSIYSFAIIFYLVTLFLTCNLVIKIASSFGERFLFSPSVGFCMAMPVLLSSVLKLSPGDKTSQKIKSYYWIIGAVLVVYTLILIPRNMVWKNDYTLFKSGVETSPNSGRAHGALASMYMDSAQSATDPAKRAQFYALGVHEFKKLVELFNMDPDGYYNLGVCYYGEGKEDSAIIAYKEMLKLNPKYSNAANNLGAIYCNKGQYDLATSYFLMAYKIDSNNLGTLVNIGVVYQDEKNYRLAFYYDSLALKKSPNYPPILNNMCNMHNDMGMQYVNSNELDKAIEEFTMALKCDSNSSNVIGNIGVVYQKKGNLEQAKIYYQKALSKDPKNQAFAKNLQLLNMQSK